MLDDTVQIQQGTCINGYKGRRDPRHSSEQLMCETETARREGATLRR